jgi:hypothetical protein
MRKNEIASTFLIFLAFFVTCTSSKSSKNDIDVTNINNIQPIERVLDLGFPIEFRGEGKLDYLNEWRGTVYLDKKYFTEKNVGAILRWYCKKHLNKKESLDLTIVDNLDILNFKILYPEHEEKGFNKLREYSLAYCTRDSRDSYFADNEVCYIRLKREGQEKESKTVLRGSDGDNNPKLEEWNSGKKIDVKCWSFTDKTVKPDGVYYSFGIKDKEIKDWVSLITVLYDSKIKLPYRNVTYVNDQIVYMYLGWMFVVTTDGGVTWSKWNAEDSLPTWICCDSNFINDVKINKDGTGVMKLKKKSDATNQFPSKLNTKDYGITWH